MVRKFFFLDFYISTYSYNYSIKFCVLFIKFCINCVISSSSSVDFFNVTFLTYRAKQKYRGMFEPKKSRNKTNSGGFDLNIRTLASPKVGQEQMDGRVSVLCWHAAPVANVLWKPPAIRLKVKITNKVQISSRVEILV